MTKRYTRQDLEAYAEAQARAKGLEPWLVKAVIDQESRWNAKAGNTTDGGSTGLMQVHPSNFGRFKVSAADMNDPFKNIDVGTTILREAMQKTGGDIPRALIDYNAGGTRLSAFDAGQPSKKHGGNMLPAVTEAYIPEVLLRAQKYGGPAITAEQYSGLRTRFGSKQTSDDKIFKSAGAYVQGMATAKANNPEPAPVMAQSPSIAALQASPDNALAMLAEPPPMDSTGEPAAPAFDLAAALAPTASLDTSKIKPDAQSMAEFDQHERKAIASAFGEEPKQEEYPKWLKSMVDENFNWG